MDNRDTCSLKDRKKMDATVWQWRISRVKKHPRKEPYYHCNRIGLDFNVASNSKKKLDLQLVTNGVILEVCDFAKTMNKSKLFFIKNILQRNFNLDLDNEQQWINFSARIPKVKNQMRKPPEDKNEVFTLFDTSSKPECNSNNELNVVSTELKTESSFCETDVTDDSENENEFSQATSKDDIKTESVSEDMDGAYGDGSDREEEFKFSQATSKDNIKTEEMDGAYGDGSEHTGGQPAEELMEDVLPHLFPCCEEIGLNLDVGSKQSLDPGLLTKGVMLELVHFTKILTGTHTSIVLDVLEHNFELDLKSQQGKRRAWSKISQLLNKRKRLMTPGCTLSPEFKNELFSFQINPYRRARGPALSKTKALDYQFKEVTKRRQSDLKSKQEKRALLKTSERFNKRRRKRQAKDMETNTPSHHADLCTSPTAEGDHSYACPPGEPDTDTDTANECDTEQEEMETEKDYLCPLGESDLEPDEDTDSRNAGNQDHLQNPISSLSSDMPRESKSSCQAPSTDVASTLPVEHSNVNPPVASQPDKRGLCGIEEQTQETPRNLANKYDMEIEKHMWKLRANRVKQILSSPNKEFSAFYRSKKFGIEFNVGFGPKQNFNVNYLPNAVLLEIAKFALAINSSQQDFIMEILEYNFDLGLQSQHQRNRFTSEMMNRVKKLRRCEDGVKLSKEVFELPGPMPSILSGVEDYDLAPVDPPHSHDETKEHILQKIIDLYPFCKEIGLKLQVNHSQPNKKLDINKLTNGAMTEVTNFAEKLCGTFEQICLDIFRHNFDLDLQSGESDFARSIVTRIPAVVDQKNLANCVNPDKTLKGTKRDTSTMVEFDCQNNQNVDACDAGSSPAAITDQNAGSSTDPECQNELNLKLWKLRANHIQQILSIPHEEHCPLYSYSRCKKLGIDFNVGSGVKQNLDPKLLTNGIMVELNTFATELLSAQKHFVTEILEYNFHLAFDNELHRSAFAQQTMEKINAKKKYSTPQAKRLFELPDLKCIQEVTTYCPKCYQDRSHKLYKDESDPDHIRHPHPHTMTDTVSADANCKVQKSSTDPSTTFSETIMDSYPFCKEIGLNLCVDKDQSKDQLDMHVLTRGIVNEVASFANKLCGTKNKIINDVLEHNFNIDMQRRDLDPALLFRRVTARNDGRPAWFSEVYGMQQYTHRPPGHIGKLKQAAAMHSSQWKETVKKRKLKLQAKKKRATLPSHNISLIKSKTNAQSKGNRFSTCTEMGMDLDMTSASGEKEIRDSTLLTGAVCDMGQDEMGTENDYTCPLGESDQDSDIGNENDMEEEEMETENYRTCSLSESDVDSDEVTDTENAGNQNHLPSLTTTTDISSSLPTVKLMRLNVNPPLASQSDKRELCGGEEQTQTPRNAPNECDMKPEETATEKNMWKVRTNRVKRILSALEFGQFHLAKKFGLEFNVGFGQKQNKSVDSMSNSVLLEVAKFALAMNSSQQYFLMEILEYNFNINLPSESQKNIFTSEFMNRVRQINMANQSMGRVNAETKQHISGNSVDLYPSCKKLGLKLQVNNSQPNKKLDLSKLTNGAMTEMTNLAEKLCGTFDQICLDILSHNFDLDLQGGESDLARSIVARIPAVIAQKNLSSCVKAYKNIKTIRKDTTKTKQDCQNDQNVEACVASSSQAAVIDQDVGNAPEVDPPNELDLKLWKLRANHIQEILSIPHVEHCPLYSYSRCKKLGIDFNVGSGVKQNLDPKLLTNGIMVELNAFSTALLSAQKHFITEILEYNFHLVFSSELHRNAFAQQTVDKARAIAHGRSSTTLLKMVFDLPHMKCIQEPTYDRIVYCPKCYQDRNHKLRQDESDPRHPHPHTKTGAGANCTAQKPAKNLSSTFSAIEETIMDGYPRCREIGLNLCVDKDQPKVKLDTQVLTREVMSEVAHFAKKLCATKTMIIHAVLEHNFNLGVQRRELDLSRYFRQMTGLKDGGLAWFDEVFVIQPFSHRSPGYISKVKQAAALHSSERKETIKKRKLALKTKGERSTLPSSNISVIKKSKRNANRVPVNRFPICKDLGLDLDVTSESVEREKLDLELLTGAVALEIHKFATRKTRHYFPQVLYDILDYNFDISSQHYRRWEFSIAAASEVQTLVKQYRRCRSVADKVFKLPFVFESQASERIQKKRQKSEKRPQKEPNKKTNKGRFVRRVTYHSDINRIHFLDGVKTNEEAWFQTDPGAILEMMGSRVNGSSGSPLARNETIKEEEYDPHYGNMKPEPDSEENYHPHFDDVKTDTEDDEHLVPGEFPGSLGQTLMDLWPNSDGLKSESENENDEDLKFETDPGTMVQMNGSLLSVGGSPLQGNAGIKEEECDPRDGNMKPEPDTEEKYHPHDDVKTESTTEDVEHSVPGQSPTESVGYTLMTVWPNYERQETESENKNDQYYVLAQPQLPQQHSTSSITTKWTTEGGQYLVPVEAAGSHEYSMVTIGQGAESTSVKEVPEKVPVHRTIIVIPRK